MPFEVDRKLLKDLEKMGEEVCRIEFLSAGMSPFSYRRFFLISVQIHFTKLTW